MTGAWPGCAGKLDPKKQLVEVASIVGRGESHLIFTPPSDVFCTTLESANPAVSAALAPNATSLCLPKHWEASPMIRINRL